MTLIYDTFFNRFIISNVHEYQRNIINRPWYVNFSWCAAMIFVVEFLNEYFKNPLLNIAMKINLPLPPNYLNYDKTEKEIIEFISKHWKDKLYYFESTEIEIFNPEKNEIAMNEHEQWIGNFDIYM